MQLGWEKGEMQSFVPVLFNDGLNYLVSHLCSDELDSFERDCFKYGDESIVLKRTLKVQFVKLDTFYCRIGFNTCIILI